MGMWTIAFKNDTEVKGVGTCVATNGEFTYSRRLDTLKEDDITAFSMEAKEGYEQQKKEQDEVANVESSVFQTLLKVLNS